MSIKVDTIELQGKSTHAGSLASQLHDMVSEVSRTYHGLDPKVKSRQSIDYSLKSLEQRLQRAEQRMEAISRFLSAAASKYTCAEMAVRARTAEFLGLGKGSGAGINDTTKGKDEDENYFLKSLKQLVLGNFTDDVTILGTLGQIALGIFDFDLPMDIRDISADFANWKWSWGHAGQTALDMVGLLPVIGALKYADEVGTLVKHGDDLADGLRHGDEVVDGLKGLGDTKRLIHGTPGVVTGGDSTTLGRNIMESMGLKRSTKWSGHQAQHIIPAELADNPALKKIGMDLDDASNGILLRVPDADVSTMSRHRGYHSVYNDVVKRQLDSMDIDQSVDVLQKQVFDLQSDLRKLQESGLPLYPSQGATVDLWERSLKRLRK